MKTKSILVALFLVLTGYIAYSTTAKTSNNDDYSEITLASINALTSGESGASNYGPAKETKCIGKGHKKICMCEPNYPACTESDCY